jgi:ribosomal protein S18 acetylase RimI-like enzyme
MTQSEFDEFLRVSIAEYAEEKTQAGNYKPEEALERSRGEFEKLLPEGLATKDHYLFSIYAEDLETVVGDLWVAIVRTHGPTHAFVYDVKIGEAFRRRGYAQAAFKQLEEKVREWGLSKISLHVFGHNTGAQALYQGLGYLPTNISMSKEI